ERGGYREETINSVQERGGGQCPKKQNGQRGGRQEAGKNPPQESGLRGGQGRPRRRGPPPLNKIVYPSGSDRAAYSLPMLVPAPALFSMNTVWPHIAESFSASMRATISFGPPAATGTMIRTGFVGYPAFDVCARAASGHAAAPPSVTINSRRRIWIAMRPSRGGSCPCNGRGRYHVFIPRCTVNDCSGSIATDEVEITRSRMSASPLKADNLHTISASPLSAISRREQMQQ